MNKKDKIIEIATQLFVEQGFENTPTSQISKESGIGTGTLFYHFKTKEDLINEIYKRFRSEIDEYIIKGITTDESEILSNIQLIWTNLIKWKFKNKTKHLFIEKYFESSYFETIKDKFHSKDSKVILQLFESAKKNNLIKEIPSSLIESITLNISKSFLIESYKINKLPKELLELSFQVYWDAIKK